MKKFDRQYYILPACPEIIDRDTGTPVYISEETAAKNLKKGNRQK